MIAGVVGLCFRVRVHRGPQLQESYQLLADQLTSGFRVASPDLARGFLDAPDLGVRQAGTLGEEEEGVQLHDQGLRP